MGVYKECMRALGKIIYHLLQDGCMHSNGLLGSLATYWAVILSAIVVQVVIC